MEVLKVFFGEVLDKAAHATRQREVEGETEIDSSEKTSGKDKTNTYSCHLEDICE